LYGANYLQKGKGPVCRRQVLGDLMQFPVGRGVKDSKSNSGTEVRRESQRLICRHFCDKLPDLFSRYCRGRGTTPGRHLKDGSDKSFIQFGKGLFGGTP